MEFQGRTVLVTGRPARSAAPSPNPSPQRVLR